MDDLLQSFRTLLRDVKKTGRRPARWKISYRTLLAVKSRADWNTIFYHGLRSDEPDTILGLPFDICGGPDEDSPIELIAATGDLVTIRGIPVAYATEKPSHNAAATSLDTRNSAA